MTEITAPGVYDIHADDYHADPVPGGSLSSSGARNLLAPSCPARFRYEQDHPPEPKAAFDLGHAAHKLVLGHGPELVKVEADSWRTNKAKDKAREAREAGAVPLLTAQHDQVHAMAQALRAYPIANALLAPGWGEPERSLFWVDEPSGIWRRARLDLLPHTGLGRMVIPDYKTCHSAHPGALAKALQQFGYHQQACWYSDAVQALGLADDVAFLFICQEKTPPYLVTVIQLTHLTLMIGERRNRQAIDLYKTCRDTGSWPGYSNDIELVALPPWAEAQQLEEVR